MDDVNQIIREFIEETKELVGNIESISDETAIELYDMYDECAKLCSDNKNINPSIRVKISIIMDEILERIVDIPWFEIKVEAQIYTPAIQGYRFWGNTELMKDKGLTGYMLGKEVGAESKMFFCSKQANYSYSEVLSDMELISCDKDELNEGMYEDFLIKNYNDMDILILHGMYNETIKFLAQYRILRPDGIVYCGLDMNRYWMKRIDWNAESARNFARQCNIIATSCTSLRDKLNANPDVSFICRYLPNGFYNPLNIKISAEYESKQNTIITVGRIGSEQKNNIELMLAFAKISKNIPGWNLKFIGEIETEFEEVIEKYFKAMPELKDRVVFTGGISDKKELYKEYSKAKIFALTSILEGGPNVYAEALFHGCMFITSDIDAADDITNHGELGEVYKLGEVDELAKAILRVCTEAEKETIFKTHMTKALEYAKKKYDWKRNAKKLAYQLFAK